MHTLLDFLCCPFSVKEDEKQEEQEEKCLEKGRTRQRRGGESAKTVEMSRFIKCVLRNKFKKQLWNVNKEFSELLLLFAYTFADIFIQQGGTPRRPKK